MTEKEVLDFKLSANLLKLMLDEKIPFEKKKGKMDYLVRIGADVNAKVYGKSMALWAKELGDENLIKYVKERGGIESQISKEKAKKLGKEIYDENRGFKDLEKIKELILYGADMDVSVDMVGNTSLIKAALYGDTKLVKLLLDSGADVGAINGFGKTALMAAADTGYEDIVELLLDKGADIDEADGNGETALMLASADGYDKVVKLLVDRKASIDKSDEGGQTALMKGATYGHNEVVELLLDNGADIKNLDMDGETALFGAVRGNKAKTVELLLKRGAYIDEVNFYGVSVLEVAKQEGCIGVLEVLEQEKEKQKKNNSCSNGVGGLKFGDYEM